MAKMHKLTKGGQTIYPATIYDAVVNPKTRKSLVTEILELEKKANTIDLIQTDVDDLSGKRLNNIESVWDFTIENTTGYKEKGEDYVLYSTSDDANLGGFILTCGAINTGNIYGDFPKEGSYDVFIEIELSCTDNRAELANVSDAIIADNCMFLPNLKEIKIGERLKLHLAQVTFKGKPSFFNLLRLNKVTDFEGANIIAYGKVSAKYYGGYLINSTILEGINKDDFAKGLDYSVQKCSVKMPGWKNDVDKKLDLTNEQFENIEKDIETLKDKSDLKSGGKLKGKKLAILGDSISTFEGYLTPPSNLSYYPDGDGSMFCDVKTVGKTWWHQLCSKTGMTMICNNSYSGSTLSNQYQCRTTDAVIRQLGTNGMPDVIIVFAGTNDMRIFQKNPGNIIVGELDTTPPYNVQEEIPGETGDTEMKSSNWDEESVIALGNSTFYESVRAMIIRIQYYYPDAHLLVCSPTYTAYEGFYSPTNELRKAIQNCCEMLGVHYLDLRIAFPQSRFKDYIFKNVHPNAKGMTHICNTIYNKLMSSFETEDLRIIKTLEYEGIPVEQKLGESFNPEGLTFTATYEDGNKEIVESSNITFDPYYINLGNTSVKAKYQGVSTVIKFEAPLGILTDAGYTLSIVKSFRDLKFNQGYSIAYQNAYYVAASLGRIVAPCLSVDKEKVNGISVEIPENAKGLDFVCPESLTGSDYQVEYLLSAVKDNGVKYITAPFDYSYKNNSVEFDNTVLGLKCLLIAVKIRVTADANLTPQQENDLKNAFSFKL